VVEEAGALVDDAALDVEVAGADVLDVPAALVAGAVVVELAAVVAEAAVLVDEAAPAVEVVAAAAVPDPIVARDPMLPARVRGTRMAAARPWPMRRTSERRVGAAKWAGG